LVEDNIFDSLRHAMMVQVGATGNVFGYNYSTHPVQGDGEKNLNNGWTPPDISIHGHYPYMNLFEGNDVYEIGIADYWGPAGVGNTYFRNKVKGEGIFYYDQSHYQNLLANETTKITDSDGKSKNKLEHGNIVSGKIIWNSSIPQRELPASLYLHNQPKFLDKCIIPFYGPDNPEKQKLPAQIRYEDIIKNAKLNPRADIKFEIKLNNKPLQGAIIKLNNDSLQTTIDGISTFYDRPAGTLYSFKISKAGYNEIIGSFSLKADTTLVIALVNTFVENNHIENTVEIFPTPVRDYLKYKTTFDYRLLEILDISGKLIYRIDKQSSDSDLNVSFLEPGLYFLRFTGDEIYQQQSKFIKL